MFWLFCEGQAGLAVRARARGPPAVSDPLKRLAAPDANLLPWQLALLIVKQDAVNRSDIARCNDAIAILVTINDGAHVATEQE